MEFRDDLPILLNDREIIYNIADIANQNFETEKTASICSVFNTPENSDDEVLSIYFYLSDNNSYTFLF